MVKNTIFDENILKLGKENNKEVKVLNVIGASVEKGLTAKVDLRGMEKVEDEESTTIVKEVKISAGRDYRRM